MERWISKVKISQNNKCTRCNVDFEWMSIVPQNIQYSKFEVEKIPIYATQPFAINKIKTHEGYNYPLEVMVNCPKCDCVNQIEVEYTKDFFL